VVAHITHLQVKQVPRTPAMKLKNPAALLSFTNLQTLCLDLDFRRRRGFTSFWDCIAKMNLGNLTIGALPHQVTQAKFIPGLQLHLRLAFSETNPERSFEATPLWHAAGVQVIEYNVFDSPNHWEDE
jgi:hypothetical protein